jgi:hypothetical protein
MSRSIVPLRIINIPNGIILPTPSYNMVNFYFRKGWLKMFITSELDVVLDRELTGFTTATIYAPITSSDTVLTALGKIQQGLNSIAPGIGYVQIFVIGDWIVTGGGYYINFTHNLNTFYPVTEVRNGPNKILVETTIVTNNRVQIFVPYDYRFNGSITIKI